MRRHVARLFWGLVGLGLCCLVVGWFWSEAQRTSVVHTSGEVVELVAVAGPPHGPPREWHALKLRFRTRDGEQVEFVTRTHYGPTPVAAGEVVSVAYVPDDPSSVALDDEPRWGFGVFSAGVGLLVLAGVLRRLAWASRDPAEPT